MVTSTAPTAHLQRIEGGRAVEIDSADLFTLGYGPSVTWSERWEGYGRFDTGDGGMGRIAGAAGMRLVIIEASRPTREVLTVVFEAAKALTASIAVPSPDQIEFLGVDDDPVPSIPIAVLSVAGAEDDAGGVASWPKPILCNPGQT
jgi:hypothetical protein